MRSLRTFVAQAICRTPLQYLPVRVRRGPAAGARWTALPFSMNWRRGGEEDVGSALDRLGDLGGDCCWDLGAHFGIHTVGMAMAVGPSGQVAAFEPDPVAFGRLRRHVSMNRLPQVRLFPCAAGRCAGRMPLVLSGGGGSSYSHFCYEDETLDGSAAELEVEVVSLDDLVSAGAVRPPRFVKIDIQGHGDKALDGARATVAEHLPEILLSSHSRWELEGSRALLEPLGYRPFDSGGRPVDWPSFVFETALLRPNGR